MPLDTEAIKGNEKMDLKVRTIANAAKKRHFQSGKNKYVLLML